MFKRGFLKTILLIGLVPASVIGETLSYDQLFQRGLESENEQNWTEAIQYYLEAGKANPKAPWTEQRIAAIFKKLQELGEPLARYEVLLPFEMLEKFRKSGVIKQNYDRAGALRRLNFLIWGSIVFLLLVVAGVVGYIVFKKQSSEEERLLSLRQGPKRPQGQRAAGGEFVSKTNSGVGFKKETKITEKTREEISGIFSSVKSLTGTQESPPAEEIDLEGLRQSGIVQALAQNLVTEVSVEEAQDGKFSKMTVEASLLFDDEKAEEVESKSESEGESSS